MFKISTVRVMLIILIVLVASATIAKASSASFVAEMMMKDEKGKITEGPFYFQNSTYRYDFKDEGKNYYLIVKLEDTDGIVVDPNEKLYSRMDKFSMAMAGNVIEVFTVAESFVAQGLYELSSETEEEYQGLKCTKKIYSLKYKEPSGLSADELKAAEVWIAKKYNLPIKIITFYKGKERAKFELKNIKDRKPDTSLFSIPKGYTEISSESPREAKKKPDKMGWLKKVNTAPVLNLPFEGVLKEGEIVRVKTRVNYALEFDTDFGVARILGSRLNGVTENVVF